MTVEIGLKHGRFALIDDEDEPLVRQYGWWIALSRSAGGGIEYARGYTRGQRKQPLMHKLLTGLPFVDHINGNGLDNRRCNLRGATRSQNQWNQRKIYKPTSSRFKGVSMHPHPHPESGVRRWAVSITQEGARHPLGLFEDEIAAALAYDAAARARFGGYAALNFPGPGERGALRLGAATGFTDELLREIADVYRSCPTRRPTAAVMQHFRLHTVSNARRWVFLARKAGHLSPYATVGDA